MAIIKSLKTDNALVHQKIEANIIKGTTFEGLPVASKSNYGMVKFDNSTIKLNSKNELCAVFNSDDIVFDNAEIIDHIQDVNIHLTPSQTDAISKSYSHINDSDKHITQSDRNKLNDFSNFISNIESHTSDRDIHVTIQDKNTLILASDHINNSDLHMSDSDREAMNSVKNLSENLDNHKNDEGVHFVNEEEKVAFRNGIADSVMAISELNRFKASTEESLLNKLDKNNHAANKILSTDSDGNIVYHSMGADELENVKGESDLIANHIGNPYVHVDPTAPKMTVSATAPANPRVGDLWIVW